MVSSHINLNATLWNDKKLVQVQAGSKTYHINLKRAYALAHSLLKTKEYIAATQILEAIAQSGHPVSRTAVMLARCKIGMRDYQACKTQLQELIPEDTTSTVDRLQAAFVFDSVGMRWDAARELVEVVNERPDLPSICLLLGDLLASLGNIRKAAQCWQLAMKRDANCGLVANAAKEEIAKLDKSLKKTVSKREDKPAA